MAKLASMWAPTKIRRFERRVRTSMCPAIVQTDAGRAYAKVLGNPEGPHALAKEWIGTKLAARLGLPVLDHAILELQPEDTFEWAKGQSALPGPAFLTREVESRVWGGDAAELASLTNPDDVGRLVVLDTWLLNRDRYPRTPNCDGEAPHPAARFRRPNYGNVLLVQVAGEGADPRMLVAMDFSHSICAGSDLTPRVNGIESTKDQGVYGLFPEFKALVREEVVDEMAERLRRVDAEEVRAVIASVPEAWQVEAPARDAIARLLSARAAWLADRIAAIIARHCWAEGSLWGQGDVPR